MNRPLRRNGSSAPQGSSLAGKRLEPDVEDARARPTPERSRHAEFGVDHDFVTEVVVYSPDGGYAKEKVTARRVKPPEDAYCDQITNEMYNAAIDFRKLGMVVHAQKITGSYDGIAVNTRGPRIGGVGASVKAGEAMSRYKWFITQLGPDLAWIAERTLVLEDLHFADLGAMRSSFKDRATLRGVGYGVWHTMLTQLAQLFRKERALSPSRQSDLMRDTERLMPKMPEVKRLGEQIRRR